MNISLHFLLPSLSVSKEDLSLCPGRAHLPPALMIMMMVMVILKVMVLAVVILKRTVVVIVKVKVRTV